MKGSSQIRLNLIDTMENFKNFRISVNDKDNFGQIYNKIIKIIEKDKSNIVRSKLKEFVKKMEKSESSKNS